MSDRGFVRLLATGGTIATVDTPSGRSAPLVDAASLALLASRTGVELRPSQVSQTASWALGAREMWDLARRARDAATEWGCLGVVVTHGTSTLEYTAFFADLALDVDIPVVFTGAMRRADDPRPDGPRNLAAAVRVAAAPAARGRGALVCFAGEIFAARDVWKAQRSDVRAFVGLEGPVGTVEDDVRFGRSSRRSRSFRGDIEHRVAVVKAYPGCDGSGVDAAIASGARGIVLEGLPGSGGIPPAMRDAVARASERARLVVLASRAPYGRLADTSGGTGAPLAGLRLASAGPLTAEKSWVLLTVVLGNVSDDASAIATFEEVANT